MLKDLNPFVTENGIHVHENAGDFEYSDGDDVERYLKEVLAGAKDLSSVSPELELAIQDWATEYHLSSKRANLLRGLDFSPEAKVLEIGCGCGAISRFLGERGLWVDAIEGSASRAELARMRCRNLDNVEIYRANFNDLVLPEGGYDAVVLIGVTEYAARFMEWAGNGEKPILGFLNKVRTATGIGGKIYIAIENRVGMKYMLGAHEDHYGRKFVGIHDYFGENDINTYTLDEWMELFQTCGLGPNEVYLPFPDYKLPTVIMSRQYASTNRHAFCHLDGVESRDYVDQYKPGVRESLLWEAATSGRLLDRLANSFLFIVSPGHSAPGMETYDFIHLPDFRRKRKYCLVARKKYRGAEVERTRLTDEVSTETWITQRVLNEAYHPGGLLSVEWARSLEIEPDGDRFIGLVREYVKFLETRTAPTIDLTPSNIIIDDATGEFHAFDEEWVLEEETDREFLLFRSLLMLAVKSERAVRDYAGRNWLHTVEDFIVHVAERVGIPLKIRIPQFVEMEERFQGEVSANRTANLTGRLLATRLCADGFRLESVKPRIYWKYPGGSYDETESVAQTLKISDERQILIFKLPPRACSASHIRFDPCDDWRAGQVGILQLYRIDIRVSSSEEGSMKTVMSFGNPGEMARYGKMSGMHYAESPLGRRFMISDDDPWIEFEFIPRRKLTGNDYLEVELQLKMPYSVDYALARDLHLEEIDRLKAAGNSLAVERGSYQEAEEELKRIKNTRFWKLFTAYSHLRNRVSGLEKKISLWSAVYRSLGFKGGSARLKEAVKRRVRRALGHQPATGGPPTRYEIWRDTRLERARQAVTEGPLISVVMPVYNTDPQVLERAISSVRRQIYPNWELCIADDASTDTRIHGLLERLSGGKVKVRYLDKNQNISTATNAAAELANGTYLAFMDNDDELAEDALNAVAKVLVECSPDCLYTDEDFIRLDGHLDDPHFKPDYSPDLLLSHNYVTHLLVMQKALFDSIGGLRSEFDGAQDYDLVLRAVEQATDIVHLPKPLYHWRKSPGSTSLDPLAKRDGHDNARKALAAALERRGINGRVEDTRLPHFFRVRRSILGDPKVSVIIPFKDKPELLRTCVESVIQRSSYTNYEILGISNDSVNAETFAEMQRLEHSDKRVRFLNHDIEFNFSRLVNFGVSHADSAHVVLLNNDVEVLTEDWLESLLEHSQRGEVAAVGGKLLYPDNRIQHAGLGIGLGGYAGHLHKNFRADSAGYFNRLNIIQNVSAVTGAMMMIEKSKYEKLDGFDELKFSIAFNDVDFCLRARAAGYLHVFTPYAEAIHSESVSRGYETTTDRKMRFAEEMKNLRERHGAVLDNGDPYYNPNFDQGRDDFTLPRSLGEWAE